MTVPSIAPTNELLTDRVAFVTGGASGLGRAAVLALAAKGAKVVVADRDVDLGRQTAADVTSRGGQAHFVPIDVCVSASVEQACDAAVERFGRIDCAFNSAGIMSAFGQPLAEVDEGEWDRIIDVNLKGTWLSMKFQLRHMIRTGGGSIVNAASVIGLRGGPAAPIYSASKHGVIGLTKSAALQYAAHGVRVNAICPGFAETPLFDAMRTRSPETYAARMAAIPMRRLARPEEVAATVVWLCLDASSYTTGTEVVVDGGFLAG